MNLDIHQLIIMLIPLLFAVTVHEAAHGWTALKMGDSTALMMGRVTLNPIRHMDPVGSFLLPLILHLSGSPIMFGYAKPVPVNSRNFRNFKKGTLLVSIAGVAANLLTAVVSSLLLQVLYMVARSFMTSGFGHGVFQDFADLLAYSVIINIVLMVFNLIPIPPLDGSRVLAMFLPVHLRIKYDQLERYGMVILILLLMTGLLGRVVSIFVRPLASLLLG